MLRDLLKGELAKNEQRYNHIIIRIQDIGKDKHPDEPNDVDFFLDFKNEAVNRFIDDILKLRRRRIHNIYLGTISIMTWVSLSLIYITSSYLISSDAAHTTHVSNFVAILAAIGSVIFFNGLIAYYQLRKQQNDVATKMAKNNKGKVEKSSNSQLNTFINKIKVNVNRLEVISVFWIIIIIFYSISYYMFSGNEWYEIVIATLSMIAFAISLMFTFLVIIKSLDYEPYSNSNEIIE